jgi:hypothetical protein
LGAKPGSITEMICDGLILSQTKSKSLREHTTIIRF